jgi:hypothetical protein
LHVPSRTTEGVHHASDRICFIFPLPDIARDISTSVFTEEGRTAVGVSGDLIFGWRFGRIISASVGQQLGGWLIGRMSINGFDGELGDGILMFAQGRLAMFRVGGLNGERTGPWLSMSLVIVCGLWLLV